MAATPTIVTVTDYQLRRKLLELFPAAPSGITGYLPYAVMTSPLGPQYFIWRDMSAQVGYGWRCSCSTRRSRRACRHIAIVMEGPEKAAGSLRAERAVATRYGKRGVNDAIPYIQIVAVASTLDTVMAPGYIYNEIRSRVGNLSTLLPVLTPAQGQMFVDDINWFQRAMVQQQNELETAIQQRDSARMQLRDYIKVSEAIESEPSPVVSEPASAGQRRIKIQQEVANG